MPNDRPDPQANEHDQRAAMVVALLRIAEAVERIEKLLQERKS